MVQGVRLLDCLEIPASAGMTNRGKMKQGIARIAFGLDPFYPSHPWLIDLRFQIRVFSCSFVANKGVIGG